MGDEIIVRRREEVQRQREDERLSLLGEEKGKENDLKEEENIGKREVRG